MSIPSGLSGMLLSDANRSGDPKKVCLSLRQILEEVLHSIPLNYRMVFLMRELNEFSEVETASVLDLKQGEVEKLLDHSKELIIDKLRQYCDFDKLYKMDPESRDAMVLKIMNLINYIN